jgi:hypothetical protein
MAERKRQMIGKRGAGPVAFIEDGPASLFPLATADVLVRDATGAPDRSPKGQRLSQRRPSGRRLGRSSPGRRGWEPIFASSVEKSFIRSKTAPYLRAASKTSISHSMSKTLRGCRKVPQISIFGRNMHWRTRVFTRV